jgi:hypothetical protein
MTTTLGKEFLGKNHKNFFAEGYDHGPRQRFLRRLKIPRGLFAEGSPQQSLCRGFLGLCPGPLAKHASPVVVFMV